MRIRNYLPGEDIDDDNEGIDLGEDNDYDIIDLGERSGTVNDKGNLNHHCCA